MWSSSSRNSAGVIVPSLFLTASSCARPCSASVKAILNTRRATAGVVVYLHRVLDRVLEDACGNADRAQFWAGCAHVLLVLVPLVIQLACADPNPTSRSDPGSGLWLTLAQLKWGLLGLVGTVV